MDWLLGNEIIAVVTWAATGITVVGAFLSYRALRLSDSAAKRSQAAAQVASDAANEAVAAIRQNVVIAELASAYRQIEMLKSLIERSETGASRIAFSQLKRSILETCLYAQAARSEENEIRQVRRNLNRIDAELDKPTIERDGGSKARILRSLRGISTFLVESEYRLKLDARRGRDESGEH